MRIIVGMSGGVDSSVAALLLKRQGHEVIGVFMKNWQDDDDEYCTAAEDYEDVAATCEAIGIPYYAANFTQEYRDRVFATFLAEYEAGRTPNPDVLCNSEIKFNAFLDYAMQADADMLATGHYARVVKQGGRVHLLRGADRHKDQSYFLCTLNQRQLANVVFPIGELQKADVRRIAREAWLPTAQKKDSTGICFIGERKFVEFISQHIPSHPGDMVDIDSGETLARHDGLSRYTIGQRKGIGIGGGGSGEPWFVVDKDAQSNTLYIGQGKEHPALFYRGLETEGFSWVAGQAPGELRGCTAKFRYRQKDVEVSVAVQKDGLRLRFADKQRAVTLGQYAVLYRGEECLGGGVISKALHEC